MPSRADLPAREHPGQGWKAGGDCHHLPISTGLVLKLSAPHCSLLCSVLSDNLLPLVMGGTLYFKESWAGPGYFIAGLQLLRGGEGRCSSSTVIPHARAWSSCAETFLKQLSVSLCRAGGRLGLKAAAGSMFLQAQPCPCFAMCCVLNICSLLGL